MAKQTFTTGEKVLGLVLVFGMYFLWIFLVVGVVVLALKFFGAI